MSAADLVAWVSWWRDSEADLAEADTIEVGLSHQLRVGLRSGRNPTGPVVVVTIEQWYELSDLILLNEANLDPDGPDASPVRQLLTEEPGNPGLVMTEPEWRAFCDAVREGRFETVEDYREDCREPAG